MFRRLTLAGFLAACLAMPFTAQAHNNADMFSDQGYGPPPDWVPQVHDSSDMFAHYEPYTSADADMFGSSAYKENVMGGADMFGHHPVASTPDTPLFSPPESYPR